MAAKSELLTLLEREAAAEREQILKDGRAQAETLVAQARREAEEHLAATRSRLEAEAKAALVKARSTAQLRAASMVLQAKEQEIARIFASAEAELARFARDPQRYAETLRAFIEEGLRGFEGQAVITVNPADQAIAQELVRARGWNATVQSDASVQGGARISSPDGRFVVTNTVASRLERARPALAAEVARVLWES
ncbi:MAG: V-type ATP synthase subunit E [Armatimonadota bacterium]|nr:V-type ATP synthase subunit E [Armatimonadota bacterium]